MTDICVYVADHRDSEPIEKPPYRLLRVGSPNVDLQPIEAGPMDCDGTGESISYKNFAYSELTGLYWIWKNSRHEITGLVHYRRFLALPGVDHPLTETEIEDALGKHDFLVPFPARLGCSLAEQYCSAHVTADLRVLADAMETQPERYRLAFASAMSAKMIIPCNIMISRKELLDSYCEWLFSVLAECEKGIELFSGRSAYQMRVFGFLSERLLLVWLIANEVDCGFCDVISLGSADDLYSSLTAPYDLDLMAGIGGIDEALLFDGDFYATKYEDVAESYSPEGSLEHFLQHGIKEHRYPSPAYSFVQYADMRPELRGKLGEISAEYYHALESELKHGHPIISRNVTLGITKRGLIDFAPVYDWLYYTTRYDDVPSDYHDTKGALKHFIEVGMAEGRQGSKGFSVDAYKRRHPELVKRFGDNNLLYYGYYALGEGRRHAGVDWRYVE